MQSPPIRTGTIATPRVNLIFASLASSPAKEDPHPSLMFLPHRSPAPVQAPDRSVLPMFANTSPRHLFYANRQQHPASLLLQTPCTPIRTRHPKANPNTLLAFTHLRISPLGPSASAPPTKRTSHGGSGCADSGHDGAANLLFVTLLFLLARWSDRPAHVDPTIRILLLLLCRLQDL